ncbi:MAG: 16S rRNA (adenine(1518)-N(6)/adenine(1519)-N(6)) -dimethyltransferase RsmA [Minisyncoccus archaeiphilus]|uniref:16S rRNA (adenine(1518)-N(6)/adenine(1519)-N(6))- dimethyltransferase RsmA n=1 Tax=Minisyncoccus archaeiphilus TaxID=3238481 RepID=UPI002B0A6B52|nr:MAG: 16S rRNA (adenine(1518)-N(6)/adenine(1519)-N(6)) -dimethyltransferase RsmA [Candidatus Parcubacteria bacterium]
MSNEISPHNNIKDQLTKSGLAAQKKLGQNFLHDANIINKMVDAGNITNNDTVLEIGPGLGTITKPLSKKAKTVIAIEKDSGIADWLEKELASEGIHNVRIIKGDALNELETIDLDLGNNYKVIANIPYYITSHLIRVLLEKENRPSSIVLMIQKEVAERICKKDDNSLLSISVNYYSYPKIIHTVSRNCFHPKPKVDSAIISITPKEEKEGKSFTECFFKILKTGFSSPRKQLLKNLSQIGERGEMESLIKASGLDPRQRAETLSLEDWKKLTTSYLNLKN